MPHIIKFVIILSQKKMSLCLICMDKIFKKVLSLCLVCRDKIFKKVLSLCMDKIFEKIASYFSKVNTLETYRLAKYLLIIYLGHV